MTCYKMPTSFTNIFYAHYYLFSPEKGRQNNLDYMPELPKQQIRLDLWHVMRQ